MTLAQTLCVLLLMNVSLSLLKITSPVIGQLANNQISYSLANFGEIHYGTTLKGILSVSQESPNLCDAVSPLNNSNTILLAQRGDCSFVKKVLNGQKAGAKMVIVSDNIVEDSTHMTIADDGNGRQVHIPSLFINQQNGKILQTQLHRSQIQLSVRFDITQADKVNMTLYLNINDRHSAVLVRELRESVTQLKEYINFNISYYSEVCNGCELRDCYDFDMQYCIFSKYRYGYTLVSNEIKEYGVFLEDYEKWFQVYDLYDSYCLVQNNYYCLDPILSQTHAKVIDGYNTVDKTKLLEYWRQDAIVSGIYSYPAAKINGVKYLGNLDSEDILEMVCASLKSPPETGCGVYDYLDIVSNKTTTTNVYFILWVVLLILVVAGLIFLAVYIYRKTVKKEITNEMSLKVTEMVSQYIKLASDTEKKNRNKQIQNSREDL